jgi:hypothetical protein
MTVTVEFSLRPSLFRRLLRGIIPVYQKPFLSLTPDGLEVRFPLALNRTRIPWDRVDMLFATEKGASRRIYVEFLKEVPLEFILEEIDDYRPNIEINRQLARLGYLRGEATAEELEAARRDSEQKQ